MNGQSVSRTSFRRLQGERLVADCTSEQRCCGRSGLNGVAQRRAGPVHCVRRGEREFAAQRPGNRSDAQQN
jgi:hypothetical protein